MIFLSGHEHNLQYLETDNITQIVSGSGSKSTPLRMRNPNNYGHSVPGYAVLNIGNEHDARLGGDSMKYVEYKEFLDSVFPYARKLYAKNHAGNFKTGTTFTYHGLTSFPSAPFCWEVNNSCDVVSTTYYPLNNDFTMKDPTVVLPDFKGIFLFLLDIKKSPI